jgi:hypothetical protein
MTTNNNYTRVSVDKSTHLTAGEKKAILAVVNMNDENYFGKWLKANTVHLMVELIAGSTYKASTKHNQNLGGFGKHATISETLVTLK